MSDNNNTAQTQTLNNITNKLLLKYDNNFNTLYDTSTELDKSIMNKEELIKQNLDHANNQDKTISTLQYTIYLVIIYFILFTLHAMHKINTKILMIGFIFSLIIYAFVIYYNIIYSRKSSIALLSVATGTTLLQKIAAQIAQKKNYQCPSGCDNENSGSNDNNDDTEQLIQSAGNNPILDKQSSSNVWLNGDQSMNMYTFSPYTNYTTRDPKLNPKPFFRGVNTNASTYYHCSMKVNYSDNTGIPMKGENEIFTTIPCNQMNGYINNDNKKYICTGSNNISDFYVKDTSTGKITVNTNKCNAI